MLLPDTAGALNRGSSDLKEKQERQYLQGMENECIVPSVFKKGLGIKTCGIGFRTTTFYYNRAVLFIVCIFNLTVHVLKVWGEEYMT